MKVLFLTIGGFSGINDHGIYPDLLREFARHGHEVYVVCSEEKRSGRRTWLASEEIDSADNSVCGSGGRDDGDQETTHQIPPAHILHVRIGNITKTNLIEKGISTVMIGRQYEAAIDKYFGSGKSNRRSRKESVGPANHKTGDRHGGFDLIMYSTPPITLAGVVEHLKKKYNARTYLLLKDIFPQNAVDIGMMSTTGLKAPLYRHFCKQERKLYAVSDRIGCMSPANVRYVLEHNPEVDAGIVEVCPNSIEPLDMSITADERIQIREKYDIPVDKRVFVYGGNLGKPQGIDFMLRCLHRLRKVKNAFFLIIGSGTEYGRIERYIEKYKPSNIVLREALPKEDYDRMIAACDVGMIFLDHRFTIPNFPSRLLSYMQARVPVLALTDPNTDVGDVITGRASEIDMETLEAGTTSEAEQAVSLDHSPFGWWAESNDVRTASSLIKKISHMDHQELSTMGDNGYDYMIANYDVRDSYETIIKGMKGVQ